MVRIGSPRRATAVATVVAALVVSLVSLAPSARPAAAETSVDARSAALSSSASCRFGDIEVTYAGSGIERQVSTFTAADGSTLSSHDQRAYALEHDGLEYVLTQTTEVPAPGTVVAVHVTIGSSPADATTGEFFVAYRCDGTDNAHGGTNEVLVTCAGPVGTCPKTALDVTTPVVVPRFTG